MNHLAVVPAEKLFKYSLIKHISLLLFAARFRALLYIRHFKPLVFLRKHQLFSFFFQFSLSKHDFTVKRYSILPIYIVGRKQRYYSSLFISFVWQRYGKGTTKPSAKPGNRVPRVWVLTQVKSLSFIMGLRGVFTQKKLPNYLALLKDYRKFANENSVFTQKK